MNDLLDANVWVALSVPDHVHHAAAQLYWEKKAAERVAFCRVTALALLRLLTSRQVMRTETRTSSQAWEWYVHLLAMPEIAFMREPATVDDRLGKLAGAHSLTGGRWTDAYLAAFAIEANCRFVTFDGGFRDYRDLRLVCLTD